MAIFLCQSSNEDLTLLGQASIGIENDLRRKTYLRHTKEDHLNKIKHSRKIHRYKY